MKQKNGTSSRIRLRNKNRKSSVKSYSIKYVWQSDMKISDSELTRLQLRYENCKYIDQQDSLMQSFQQLPQNGEKEGAASLLEDR